MVDQRSASLDVNAQAVKRGVIVFSIGTLMSMAGFAMAMREFGAAFRAYVRAMPVPPSELARQHAKLVRSAAVAGATAWRQGYGEVRPAVVDLTMDAASKQSLEHV